MQRRYGQGHIDTKDAKTAVYDKTDSGSWGPVLDGSMKEAWNGETYAYSNYGDKLKDYFDTGFSHTHNVSISNGTEKSHFRTSFGYSDNDGVFPTESLSRMEITVLFPS
jgi:hypothetical protein